MQKLFANSLKTLKDLMEKFDDENYSEGDFSKKDAILFEQALITLCLFTIGGQRREIVVNITLNVGYNVYIDNLLII